MLQPRPNIVLVVTDQQRRDSIGAYGSTICRTPHTDRLAAVGIRFDRAYTPCGLCSPARSTLLTGQYPSGHGTLTNIELHPLRNQIGPDQDILASGLRRAGYRLGYVGKWHVNRDIDPTGFGFERYVSLADYQPFRAATGIPQPRAVHDYLEPVSAVDPIDAERSRQAFLTDSAIDMIEEFSAGGDAEAPFFVRLDFHGPHPPMVVPEAFASMYDPGSIPEPANFADDLVHKPAVQRAKRQHWGTDRMDWAHWQPILAHYYGEISLIDHQLGRLLDKLDALGIAEDTVVVYTADHGDTMGAHNIWNKDYTMYDEIYSVPLVMRWPGVVTPGSQSAAFTHHFLDLPLTFLELAGAPIPGGLPGESLRPVLHGELTPHRDRVFCEFHGCHHGLYSTRMLQVGDQKLVYNTNDVFELYDHASDPHELVNLADSPDHQELLMTLRRQMVAEMERIGDHLYNEWTVHWLTGDKTLAARAPGRSNKAMT